MAESRGARIELPKGLPTEALASPELASEPRETKPPEAQARREEPTEQEVRERLAEHQGNLVRAAKALGLPSRYALYRLLRKHAIDVDDFRHEEDASPGGIQRKRS